MTMIADQALATAELTFPDVGLATDTITGHQAILAQLLADGLDHMFGNPGTVEVLPSTTTTSTS